MISFKKYLQEKAPIEISLGINDTIKVFESPHKQQIVNVVQKSRGKNARFLIDTEGKMFLWDGYDGIHFQVFIALIENGFSKKIPNPHWAAGKIIKGEIMKVGDDLMMNTRYPSDSHPWLDKLQKMGINPFS